MSKKFPTWAKVLIIGSFVGVFFSAIVGIGITLLGNFLGNRGGQKALSQPAETMVESETQGSAEKVEIHATAELPTGFPSDIPIFSPAEIKGSVVMGPLTMVSFEIVAPLGQVSDYFSSHFSAQGWSSIYSSPATSQSFSGVYRKEGRQATVAISQTPEGGKVSVVLSYGAAEVPPPESQPQ